MHPLPNQLDGIQQLKTIVVGHSAYCLQLMNDYF